MMRAIKPEGVAEPRAPYSSVVESDGLVFLSGQVPFDASGTLVEGGFDEQARATFANVGRCLAAAKLGFGDVVKVNVYLADLADFAALNRIYAEVFAPPYPARTTVGARLLGFAIEVEAVARRPAADA